MFREASLSYVTKYVAEDALTHSGGPVFLTDLLDRWRGQQSRGNDTPRAIFLLLLLQVEGVRHHLGTRT